MRRRQPTSADLAWLRAQGLDRAVAEPAARGGIVLGLCGGPQMLGEALIDPHGSDGNGPGLGLFEDPGVSQALFGAAAPTLDSVFDCLADFAETHFLPGVLASLVA